MQLSSLLQACRSLLDHVNQVLQGDGHPGLLTLDENHSPVDVDDDVVKGVELLPFVSLPNDKHEDHVVPLGLSFNEVFKVHGHGAGGDADDLLGYVLISCHSCLAVYWKSFLHSVWVRYVMFSHAPGYM